MKTLDTLLEKPKQPENGIYDYLPDELNEIKQIEVETYSHRADDFAEDVCMEMGRPEFTAALREKGTEGTVFLEIAGGSASHALNMMKDGYHVIESDIAPGSVARAKEFAEKKGLSKNASFMVADAENLPFREGALDGIFMIASLHHIPDVDKALKSIHRSLKKDGVFLIGYEPAAWQYYVFWPLIAFFRWYLRKKNKGRPISLADDVTFGFSKRKLTKLLKKAGFKDITITPVYYFYKAYKNYRILVAKLKKKPYKESAKLKKFFIKTDNIIAKIPLIRGLTWDWDVVARK